MRSPRTDGRSPGGAGSSRRRCWKPLAVVMTVASGGVSGALRVTERPPASRAIENAPPSTMRYSIVKV